MQRVLVLLAGVALGCRPSDGAQLGQPRDKSQPAPAITQAAEIEEGGYAADWQDPTCEVDTTVAHPEPLALIREYVARNDSLGFAAGGGEGNDQWLFSAAECPGHLGGTDGAAVVKRYTIIPIAVGADAARYAVRYELLGSTTPDSNHMRFVARGEVTVDTVQVVRTPYGWRISGQPGDPVMGPAAVRRQSNLDPASLRALDSAERAPARPGA